MQQSTRSQKSIWRVVGRAPFIVKNVCTSIAYLRDEAIQNAKILDDILPARNKEMSQNIASQLQATDGSNVSIYI